MWSREIFVEGNQGIKVFNHEDVAILVIVENMRKADIKGVDMAAFGEEFQGPFFDDLQS